MRITLASKKLTLSVFLQKLNEELYNATAAAKLQPTPQHLYLYTGEIYTNGYPAEPYAKNEIKDDFDFYRYTTSHPDVTSRQFGMWFKAVMHPKQVTGIDETISIKRPLQRYRKHYTYCLHTSIKLPSDHTEYTEPIPGNNLVDPPILAVPRRPTSKPSETWLREGHHYRKRDLDKPGKPMNVLISEMVSSSAEPDSEADDQDAQRLFWEHDYQRALERDRDAFL